MLFFHGLFLPWMRRVGRWCLVPAILVVAWGELTPQPPHLADEVFGWDKAEHFTAYFGIALLAALAWGLKRSLIWVFVAVVALGGTLELLQMVTGRDAEWLDQLANTLGAAAGMTIGCLYLAAPRRLVDRPKRD